MILFINQVTEDPSGYLEKANRFTFVDDLARGGAVEIGNNKKSTYAVLFIIWLKGIVDIVKVFKEDAKFNEFTYSISKENWIVLLQNTPILCLFLYNLAV